MNWNNTFNISTMKHYEINRIPTVFRYSGEHLTEAELAEYMSTLLGLTEPSGSVESQSFDAKDAPSLLQENLPEEVTAEIFATRLLGLTQ